MLLRLLDIVLNSVLRGAGWHLHGCSQKQHDAKLGQNNAKAAAHRQGLEARCSTKIWLSTSRYFELSSIFVLIEYNNVLRAWLSLKIFVGCCAFSIAD